MMRTRLLLILIFLTWCLHLCAAYEDRPSINVTAIPECGVSCILASILESDCPVNNTTCLCHDQHYGQVVRDCVWANCTVVDALATKNVTWVGCGQMHHDGAKTQIWIFNGILLPLATLFYFFRVTVKALKMSSWGADDTAITIAYIGAVGFPVAEAQVADIIGQDIWTLTPQVITTFLKVFFAFEPLYIISLAMVKISIVFFYLRIFTDPPLLRRLLICTQVFNVLLCLVFLVVNLAQCAPVSYFWTRWDGEHQGWCIDIGASAYAHGMVNIVLDGWMLALPLSQVITMRVGFRKKVQIVAMFSVGMLLTAASCVRLGKTLSFGKSANVTHTSLTVVLLSTLEIEIGVVCACMPAARQFTGLVVSKTRNAYTTRFGRKTKATSQSDPMTSPPGDHHPRRDGLRKMGDVRMRWGSLESDMSLELCQSSPPVAMRSNGGDGKTQQIQPG